MKSLFDKRRIRIWLMAMICPGLIYAQEETMLVRVDAVKVEPLVQTVPVLGRLVARQAGPIAARIDGPLKSIFVEIGERVQAGQTVAMLDDTVTTAQRELITARLSEAQATVQTRNAELSLAHQEVTRLERLKDSAATTKAAYDDAVQESAIAQAKVKEAQAAVSSALANQKLADISLRNTEIKAPYSGVITERLTEVGAYVKVGDDVLRIVADQNLDVEADVPFERLSGLIPGTELTMSLDDGTSHSVVVRTIIPQESKLTRTRAVRFVPTFKQTSKPLADNQSATIHIPVAAQRNVLSVHKDAVISRGNQSIVYVVVDNAAKLRTVRLGEAVGSRFEVLEGLEDGDLAVVRGNERLLPDQDVRLDTSS
ncbi:MAG: efflux RND transporter periplasmic adaptor subunit [Gammaproteobacteria bacterium]|nr:efflux RND transporter periplasmic adaptor subunit [Gammaproteobacteria bacterium]